MEEYSDNSDIVAENSQQLAIIEPEPEKRGRGRPKGSRDVVPRRPRAVRIVEEDPREPSPDPPPRQSRASKPYGRCTVRVVEQQEAPARRMEPAPNDFPSPPSPRTLFKQASEAMGQLQGQRESARRAYWQDAISRSLR